jgi:hypothetical protein
MTLAVSGKFIIEIENARLAGNKFTFQVIGPAEYSISSRLRGGETMECTVDLTRAGT